MSYTGIIPSKKALHPMGRPPVISSVLVSIQSLDVSRNLLVPWWYKALPGSFGSVASVATQLYSFFFLEGPYQAGGAPAPAQPHFGPRAR